MRPRPAINEAQFLALPLYQCGGAGWGWTMRFGAVLTAARGLSARCAVLLLACFVTISSVFAEDDYSKLAYRERTQLTKCFSDMLTVVKRHSLRKQLLYFLEAGCAAEMSNYSDALFDALSFQLPKEFQDSQRMRGLVARLLAGQPIGSMERTAERLYTEQSVSFCSGDACPLDKYRKCLLLQISGEVTKRTEPLDFEKIAQTKCGTTEGAARSALIIDFLSAQRLQRDPKLSKKTHELIEEVITEIRHESVISYHEHLAAVQPGRKSCRKEVELCGTCINSVITIEEPEYKCAVGYEGKPTKITLKLVEQRGGKALANTQWSVLTPGGNVLAEETPAVVHLHEEYGATLLRVVARNKGRSYEHEFEVRPGVDVELEVLVR